VNHWEPIGGYNFAEDRVTLPAAYTIAPAYAAGSAQLLEGEPAALSEVAGAVRSAAGQIPLVRIVCEASGGTKAEPRIRCQLIYGVSGAVDYVEYMGAREELATHPRIIGINLAELATQKTGLT
jgi:hypothetical protein